MDLRESLKQGTILSFDKTYIIDNEISRGGSCIAYIAHYIDNIGLEKKVIIKECYPFDSNIKRNINNELIYDGIKDNHLSHITNVRTNFDIVKDRLKKAYLKNSEYKNDIEISNYIITPMDLYELNNTLYFITTYNVGDTVDYDTFDELKDVFFFIKNVSIAVKKIHNKGELYLDIKPDNILILQDINIPQFFDFDSFIKIDDLPNSKDKISFTKGFSSIEVQLRNVKKIGKHSDIYSIGATLFYLIFGRIPKVSECESNSIYDFKESKYNFSIYKSRLKYELTNFFHKSLANYYLNRYSDVDDVIESLSKMENLANELIPYVIGNSKEYALKNGIFVGREEELKELTNWYNSDKPYLYVSGIDGIGKSTLVKTFVREVVTNMTDVVYLTFNKSIVHTINDDSHFKINTLSRNKIETDLEYFNNKIEVLKEIVNNDLLVVIDNFDGVFDSNVYSLFEIKCKIIFISQTPIKNINITNMLISPLNDKNNLYEIVEHYIERKIREDEYMAINYILETIDNHTLMLVLLSLQIKHSYIDSIEDIIEGLKGNGFLNIGKEKILFHRDNNQIFDTMKVMINMLFDFSKVSEKEKRIFKLLSLFKECDVNFIDKIVDYDVKDSINLLKILGWLDITDNVISMHPVISEIVLSWELSEDNKLDVIKVLEYFCIAINIESKREDYSKYIFENNLRIYNTSEEMFKRYIKNSVSNLEYKTILMRFIIDPERHIVNRKYLTYLLGFVKNIILCCQRPEYKVIKDEDIYKECVFNTLMALPLDNQNDILDIYKTVDLENANPNAVMLLYDKLIEIYVDKEDYNSADMILHSAKELSIKKLNRFVRGKYYSMLASNIEREIDGNYYYDEEKDKIDQLLKYLNKSIFNLKLSKNPNKYFELGIVYCFKASILIRTRKDMIKEIIKCLTNTREIIDKYCYDYSNLNYTYYLTNAWYYGLCKNNRDKLKSNIMKAKEIVDKTNKSDMDMINVLSIYSNILYTIANGETLEEDFNESIKLLEMCIKLCDKNPLNTFYTKVKKDMQEYIDEMKNI